MKQKRLESICTFLDKNDKIIDIGCDHAYVCIEMAKRGCLNILASDIHPKALAIAKKNITNENLHDQIKCQLSDGLKKIETDDYDTLVIAGMGTSTIIHILSESKKLQHISKLVLQSNNDLFALRTFVNNLGYELKQEQVVLENNHFYTIMLWTKGNKILTEEELEFGLYQKENQEFYQAWFNKEQKLLMQIPKNHEKKLNETKKRLKVLQKYLVH
jgi:tRNA (adenine22-N1)-methyltransferase